MFVYRGSRPEGSGRVLLVAAAFAGLTTFALAQASGPDFFKIADLKTDDNVNVRSEPNANAKIIGKIAKNTDGVKNLGCKGGLTKKQWEKANEARKKADARTGWCEVEFKDVKGWVLRRLLVEGTGSNDGPLEQQAQTPDEQKQEQQKQEQEQAEKKPETPPAPPPKIAPSFDCEKAEKHAEKLVCGDNGLAALDLEIARLYVLASEEMNATPGFEELLDGQRKWLAERNTCFDQECLAEMYVRRIHQLRQGFDAARKPGNRIRSAGPYVLRCDGLDALVGVTVVSTDPAYAYIEWNKTFAVMKKIPSASGVHYDGNFASLRAKGTKASLKLPGHDDNLTCKLETGG